MKHTPIITAPLTRETFRTLLRQKGNVFLPDRVAEGLANRRYNLTPEMVEAMADDISALVAELRCWLEGQGIEPVENDISTYDKRELRRAANLATLLAYHAFGLFFSGKRIDAAEQAVEEGIAWARFVGDHRREAFLFEAMAILYSYVLRKPEEIASYHNALQAARRPGDDPEMEVMILSAYASCLTANMRFEEAMELVEQGIERGRSALCPHDQGRYLPTLMMDRGRVLSSRNQRRDAIIALEEGLELALSVDENHPSLAAIYFHLGQIYRQLGEREKVLEMQQKTIAVAERNEQTLAVNWSYIQLATIYIGFEQPDLAEKALDIAEATVSHSSFPQLEYIYSRRTFQLRQQKRYDEAIAYARKHEELCADERITQALIATNHQLGLVYCEMGDPEKGEQALLRALALHEQLGVKEWPVSLWSALAELQLESGRLDEAEVTLREVFFAIDEEETDRQELARLFDIKGKIAENRGELKEALYCTRRSMELAIEQYEKESNDSLLNARTLADCELYRKEAEIQAMRRKKAEQSLADALTAFEDRKHALASVESQLRETLALVDEIQALEVMGVLKQAIDNIEVTIDGSHTSLHYLQTLDREFFQRLRERSPKLTRKQEHYCGLIRAGLSSKEIASTLNLSMEGVRSQRKRIRKRLELVTGDSLESAIMEI